jgi:hypothetical protein
MGQLHHGNCDPDDGGRECARRQAEKHALVCDGGFRHVLPLLAHTVSVPLRCAEFIKAS